VARSSIHIYDPTFPTATTALGLSVPYQLLTIFQR
jgi:hypothetical protein